MITMERTERQFLRQHERADLIYDENTKKLICAVYFSPKYLYRKETQSLLNKLRKIIEK